MAAIEAEFLAWATREFERSARRPGGVSESEHLALLEDHGVEIEGADEIDAPDMIEPHADAWVAFCSMRGRQPSGGFGASPIGPDVITFFETRVGYMLSAYVLAIVLRLDDAFLAAGAKASADRSRSKGGRR